MADPTRLRILKNLTAIIEAIRPEDSNSQATGYTVSLQNAVFRGRNIFGDSDPLPMVAILENPIPPDQIPSPPENPARHGDWDLAIQGFCKDDRIHPTDPAYALAADVVMALSRERTRAVQEMKTKGRVINPLFGEKAVTGFQIGVPIVRPPDETSAKAYFWLTITLNVAENLEKPYG